MKKFIKIAACVGLCLGATFSAGAQSRSALRINEVMVANDSSMIDEYGNRHAWIELFNTNFAPLEISSVFLTNDKNNPTKYPVPLGDVKTDIPERQHVVFFADGEANKGTFHTNFTLTPGQDNWIGIYDADGKTLIDEVTIPASVLPNQSWARTEDGAGEWTVRTGGADDYITPSSANIIKDGNEKIAVFAERDANGFGMTILAMAIVFTALLVLCLCFYGIGEIGAFLMRSRKAQSKGEETVKTRSEEGAHDSGEEIAAIVMALHEHLNAHDQESTVLTINKVKRAYSPWSSKIYGLRSTR